jgi:hypothetical protein
VNRPNEITPDEHAPHMLPEPWRTRYGQAAEGGRAALANILVALEAEIPAHDRARLRPQTIDQAVRPAKQHVGSLVAGGSGVAAEGRLKWALDAYVLAIAQMQAICDDAREKMASGQAGDEGETRH